MGQGYFPDLSRHHTFHSMKPRGESAARTGKIWNQPLLPVSASVEARPSQTEEKSSAGTSAAGGQVQAQDANKGAPTHEDRRDSGKDKVGNVGFEQTKLKAGGASATTPALRKPSRLRRLFGKV